MKMKILIDNGHGENTPGKRSPDGQFREYAYAREIAEAVKNELVMRGYDAERIVREIIDVPLAERARRVNEACGRYGRANVVLISIHVNAAGDGTEWRGARGWSAYTSPGKTKADTLATMMYEEAETHLKGQQIRRDTQDGDEDWEANFYMLRKTKCPAVLTENFFMDNRMDVDYLTSACGREAVVKTHVEAIIQYVNKYGKI